MTSCSYRGYSQFVQKANVQKIAFELKSVSIVQNNIPIFLIFVLNNTVIQMLKKFELLYGYGTSDI